MKTETNKDLFWLQTLGTALFIASWAIQAAGWIPYHVITEVLACIIWTFFGIRWANNNLIVMNAFIGVMAAIAWFTISAQL